jgi:glutathione peroxidase
MSKVVALAGMVAVGLLVTFVATTAQEAAQEPNKEAKQVPAVLKHTMKSLKGEDVDLSKYQGKVILFVNTASKCGFTKQYKDLEAVYEKYKDQGLVVLGFPSNDFGGQEPGSDQEIAEFCEKNYSIKFDMFSKVVVKGETRSRSLSTLPMPKPIRSSLVRSNGISRSS